MRTSVDLGYATTIHTAQGVTADTSHTLLTGQESRQLAYTAVTRGKTANHLYLEVVGDGDEHNVIRPEYVHPLTATDLLERILARDDSAQSAHTTRRVAEDPATLLGQAAARYVDSLHVGAEQLLGAEQVARLDSAADLVVPELTKAAAWPTLRAHLLLLAAQEATPSFASAPRPVHASWTPRTTSLPCSTGGWTTPACATPAPDPCPGCPASPASLCEDPQWGPYLAARAAQVRDLTQQVTEQARSDQSTPQWARTGQRRPDDELLVDVAVWRAATGVPDSDRRPTGAPQLGKAAARYQQALDSRLATHHTPALASGSPCSTAQSPTPHGTRSYRSSPSDSQPCPAPVSTPRRSSAVPSPTAPFPTTTPQVPCGGASPVACLPRWPREPSPTTTWPRRGPPAR
ncbi:helicase C-terminal domain-containing protein [Cellulomonas sp. P24]|uniref:C-terminal helicase domain-containing protein n=1 Tax=Cellulomonas sp. P24 TaxID=2885206 RepID=UPI00216ABF11|nr:helicase C-terminal domain-containing protein [Cellulomonas sp. P24]MCR6490879.1 hypothetical protein [Cellulomonas sp. P24]